MSKIKKLLPVIILVITVYAIREKPYDEFKYYRILCLGDSYTVGLHVHYTRTWPVLLAEAMLKEDLKVKSPKIYARAGWETHDLVDVVSRLPDRKAYDFIFIMAGVNNHINGESIKVYRQSIKSLIRAAQKLVPDPGRIYFFSIPDWGATPYAAHKNTLKIRREIDSYNSACYSETKIQGCGYIDITPVSRRGLADPSYLTIDGLHPSGRMYREWARLAFQ
ncbi:MAG TPA: GDSL-type esterase/lipase family protein, partial [Spirochaetota bacterium]|nr:GDSL-type esterase/lipase family protein [Spirochaetota bacterium]